MRLSGGFLKIWPFKNPPPLFGVVTLTFGVSGGYRRRLIGGGPFLASQNTRKEWSVILLPRRRVSWVVGLPRWLPCWTWGPPPFFPREYKRGEEEGGEGKASPLAFPLVPPLNV